AHADTATTELIKILQAQIATLAERIENLEQPGPIPTQTYQTPMVRKQVSRPASWTEAVRIKGDFRYRHEAFDIGNRRERQRQRIRARVALTGQVNDTVMAGFALASGSSDPLSSNQGLDDAASSKGVVLDLAYVKWQTPLEGVTLIAGKFKNPIYRPTGIDLLWDADLHQEGVAITYKQDNLFVNTIGTWLDEDADDDDSFLVGTQIGMNFTPKQDRKLIMGLGYYNFLDSKGEPVFFDGDPSGNRTDGSGNYLSGFEVIEAFLEYSLPISQGQLSLFGDFAHNLDADQYENGFAIGANYRAKSWQFDYSYRDLEADAVLATFSGSDFLGGGTDGRGHLLRAGYSLSPSILLRGTLHLNKRNIDIGIEEDYKRLILDISFKY
ncbi:MAG: hypothetical protein GXP16_09590, partial [Gammaproteobacteria bacterium]|nr:hypothetical protein [Gammaproteobacteria bacterium]